ncbi:MAG: 30S ribosomal protein S8e [Candidatus Woesearchaeota archaeon]|nr:MAG: 30S ribosomal protein S8e [Candidatus Woesearchaeota archaeon]
MSRYVKRSKLKGTGGKLKSFRKKKKTEVVADSNLTRLGLNKIKTKRARSGLRKNSLLFANSANIVTKDGVKKSKILDVIKNKSNRHFVREDIITKGAIIKTELGLAKVTSRPGQDGSINAILVEK